MNVLVTAVGGDLGQAVVKALRQSNLHITCHGCDMNEEGIGSLFVESFHIVPRADNTNYHDTICTISKAVSAEAVIPCSEPEMYALANTSPHVVCQDFAWMCIHGDKLTCYATLSAGGVELVPFANGRDPNAVTKLIAKVDYPVVVKSRRSWGSKTLSIVENKDELYRAIARTKLPVVQTYIDGDEYSVGVFACKEFTAALTFKRDLGGFGLSWYAETVNDGDVLKYVLQIAHITGLRGSANIQVRKSTAGVRLLEINPRFSSLAAARAAAGFNDVEWALLLTLGEEIKQPGNFKHMRFRRYFQEVVDFGAGWENLPSIRRKGND